MTPIIQRPSDRIVVYPPGAMQVRTTAGVAGINWGLWFDHFWQAKGAASYAASKLDLVGAQNFVEGNGAVPWAAGTGWGFVAANAQWFDTGLVPAVAWSTLIQFTNYLTPGQYLCGNFLAAPQSLYAMYGNVASGSIWWNQANTSSLPFLAAANMGIAGKNGYLNGAFVGSPGGANPLPAATMYLGALNQQGVGAILFPTVEVVAFGIKMGTLTAPQVAAAALAMSLL